ncbi:MAG: cytochrome c oxidase subunit II, partial [Bacteroidota bacterium]
MTTFLIIIVLILAVVTIAQLVRVTELAGTLKPKKDLLPTDSENRNQAWLMLLFLVAYFGFFLWLVLEFKDKLLPEAASVHGDRLDWLLNFNFLI